MSPFLANGTVKRGSGDVQLKFWKKNLVFLFNVSLSIKMQFYLCVFIGAV